MEFSSRRRKDIEDHLSKDYDLLKNYEDERRLESDPQRRARLDYQIRELKDLIQSRESQLEGVRGFGDTKLPSIGQELNAGVPDPNELQLGIIHAPAQFITSAPIHDLQAGYIALTDDLLRTHLPPQPPTDFIGRRNEINELANAAKDTVMVAATGVLGIGKTSLLRAAAARLEASSVFWHEFTPGFVTIDDVLTRLGRYLDTRSGHPTVSLVINTPSLSTHDKVSLVIGELNRNGGYLFFDRVELCEQDAALESFFTMLKERLKKGHVFLASRSKPGFIMPLDEAKRVARVIALTGLSEDEVTEYFERQGIHLSREGAEKLDRNFDGMPLALELIIALAGEGSGEAELLAQANAVQEKVVEQLFEELYSRLSLNERNLLTTAALFRLPFTKGRILDAHRALFDRNAAGDFVMLRRRCCLTSAGESNYYRVHEVVGAMALTSAEEDLKVLRGRLADHLLNDSPDDYTANLEALLLYRDAENWECAAEVAGDLICRRLVPYDLEMAERVLSMFTEPAVSRERWMWLLGDKGLVAHHQRRFAEAEERYLAMLRLAGEIENKFGEALALQRLGVLYNDKGDDARSEEHYRRSLTLKIEVNDEEGQSQIHNNLGSIYSSRGDFKRAAEELEKGLELRRRMGSPEWLYIALYSNLGILYARQQRWDEAFEYSNKALSISEELKSPYDIAKSLFNLGKHEYERGNIDAAREKFLSVLETAERYELDELEELANIALGRLYGDTEDFDQAITYFKRVGEIYEKFGQKTPLAAIYFDIGTFYQCKGDDQLAFDWYLKGAELFEHLRDEKQIELYLNNIRVMAHKLKGQTQVQEFVQAIKKLKKTLAASGASFTLASVYGTLGDIYINVLERERAGILCLRREINLFTALGLEREQVTAQIELGGTFERLGRYAEALDVTGEALAVATAHNLSDLIATIFYNRGNYYAELDLYLQAEASFRDAEMHAPQSDHANILQLIWHNLGEVLRRQGRLSDAIELLNVALSHARENNDASGEVHALNNLGLAYDEMEQEAEALSRLHEAVSVSRLHSLKHEEANTLISIGNFYLLRGSPGEAKGYYEQALNAARADGDIDMEESCILSVAQAHRDLGTFQTIQEEFKEALERANKLGHNENLTKFLAMAGEINLDEAEPEAAGEMFEQALLFTFLRGIELAQQFITHEESPEVGAELAYVLRRIMTGVEHSLETGRAEVAQNMLRSLVSRLKQKEVLNKVGFPLNYLTYAIEYIEVRPEEAIHKYIVDRLDEEKSR
jgi:tetratricopeptide (TPR) repeat protein